MVTYIHKYKLHLLYLFHIAVVVQPILVKFNTTQAHLLLHLATIKLNFASIFNRTKMNKPAPSEHIPFEKWDLDLLVDYILKFHHRNTRKYGAEIYNLLLDVDSRHHELDKVTDHFRNSIQDLDTHCTKEEQVLFPYIMNLYEAAEQNQHIMPFHCGTIEAPINMMMADHDDELSRHERIRELTNNYTAPEGAEPAYQNVLDRLKEFRDYMMEHIWIENEIVFPRALEIEETNVERY